MNSFNTLGLTEPLVKAIEELKFTEPSEIQSKSIPPILAGKDVIAQSATGSGKTLAFGLWIIQKNRKHGGIQSLVLTPTRELAIQIGEVFKKLSRFQPIKVATVYGGVSIQPQMKALRDAEVVIGTPGRVLDHLERGTLDLSSVSLAVLDEADRMLDMGFIEDVEKIIGECPKNRQTLLFSATFTEDIQGLAHRYMKGPIRISAKVHVDQSKLTEIYYDVDNRLKLSLLIHLLKEEGGIVMVFCNTRHIVDIVANNLSQHGLNAVAIHGGLTQSRRSHIMDMFHGKKVSVLVCTDVAARGLDIQGVSHIYNYDIPNDSKEYIHRIGRTARAGKEGKIVNLLSSRDHDSFSRILQDTRKPIQKKDTPQVRPLRIKWEASRPRFGDQRGHDRNRGRFGRNDRPDSRSSGRFGRSDGHRPGGRGRSNSQSSRGRFSKSKPRFPKKSYR